MMPLPSKDPLAIGRVLFAVGLLALSGASCAPESTGHEHEHAPQRPGVHEARGTLLWSEPGRVYLNHEAIPGFMDAMAMGFDVRDPSILDGIGPGTTVAFRVVVDGDAFYVDQIRPVE